MKNKGFTLIELMIVVATIGIVVSVAVAAFQESQGKRSNNSSQNFKPKFTSKETIVREYLPNQQRTDDAVTLKQHSDGTLYACSVLDSTKCFRVQ